MIIYILPDYTDYIYTLRNLAKCSTKFWKQIYTKRSKQHTYGTLTLDNCLKY